MSSLRARSHLRPRSATLRGAQRVQVGRPWDSLGCVLPRSKDCPVPTEEHQARVGHGYQRGESLRRASPEVYSATLGPEVHVLMHAPFPTPSGLGCRAHKAPSWVHITCSLGHR